MAMFSSWMFEIMKVAEETVHHLEGIQCSFIRVEKPDENLSLFTMKKNIEDVLNILGRNVKYLSYFHDEGKTIFEHQCEFHENVMFENHSAMGAKDESSQSCKMLQSGHKIQKTSQNDEMQQMACGHLKGSKVEHCDNVTCGNSERILELVDCLSNSFEFKTLIIGHCIENYSSSIIVLQDITYLRIHTKQKPLKPPLLTQVHR